MVQWKKIILPTMLLFNGLVTIVRLWKNLAKEYMSARSIKLVLLYVLCQNKFEFMNCLILFKKHEEFVITWVFLSTACVSFEISNLNGNHEAHFITFFCHVQSEKKNRFTDFISIAWRRYLKSTFFPKNRWLILANNYLIDYTDEKQKKSHLRYKI